MLPLFLLVILSFTLMTYQSNRGIIVPFHILSGPLNWVNWAFHSLSASFREPFRMIHLRDEENRRLRQDMGRLLLEQQRYRDLFFENQRLREVLSLKEKEGRYITAARVVSKGWDRWVSTLVIDKGRNSGVTKDMAVMTPLGLIGKVSLADDNYAYVLLLTDINFSASVRIQETRKEAILSGTGSMSCILKYITREEEVKENEVVVTSGFDDLFPAELPVGYISRVSKKGPGIFQQVEVRPFQDMTKLDEVIIVRR
ncbi:MAG TPA: rod shape-determining protein MreC [Thermodesulfovibrionales bacterium]|nr:rod shape-determining protein MreC [Thermodesulfovibrionales bacterium]